MLNPRFFLLMGQSKQLLFADLRFPEKACTEFARAQPRNADLLTVLSKQRLNNMRLIALLAALGALPGTASAVFDCDAGCSTVYDPVCGANGTTFANECLAFCQNIAVASAGACGSKSTRG
jgi:Kazal-type serine protease inhibitor domain